MFFCKFFYLSFFKMIYLLDKGNFICTLTAFCQVGCGPLWLRD